VGELREPVGEDDDRPVRWPVLHDVQDDAVADIDGTFRGHAATSW
jgi:hypothetical protein